MTFQLDPELQNAVASSAPAPPAPAPVPAAPVAPIGALPTTAPSGGFAPLEASTAAPTTARTPLAAALGPALAQAKNPLHFLAKVGIAGITGHIAAGLQALTGGVENALSNVAAPPDSGIGVLSQTAKNIEDQKAAKAQAVAAAQQKAAAAEQKAFENQIKAQNAATDKQKADAAMIDAHTNFYKAMRLDNDSEGSHNTAMAKNAEAQVKPILDSGGEILYPQVSETELHSQEFLSTLPQDPIHGGPDFSQWIPVFTGTTAVLNPDGTPEIGETGGPKYVRNFEIVKLGKPVTLDQSHTAFLNKYNPSGQPFQVGQVLPAQLYTKEYAAAHVAQGVELNVAKAQSEIGKNMTQSQKNKADAQLASQSAAQKAQNLRTSSMFATFLAQTGGDPVLALDLLKRSKFAGSVGDVEQLYGAGNLTKLRAQNLTTLTKTIESDQKQLNDPVASAEMSPDDKTQMQSELKAARMARNAYLGLHPNDPPQFAEFVTKLDAFKDNPQQLSSQILLSKKADPSTKRYLLNHYGLPIPAYLQVAPPAAVAAPKQ